jgi:hypothetical protein
MQCEIHETLGCAEIRRRLQRSEPKHLDRHVPRTRRQQGKSEMSIGIGHGGKGLVALRHGHCGPGNSLISRDNESALGMCKGRPQSQKEQKRDGRPNGRRDKRQKESQSEQFSFPEWIKVRS